MIIHHDCCRCERCCPTDRRTLHERLAELIPDGVKLVEMLKFTKEEDGETKRPRVRTKTTNQRTKGTKREARNESKNTKQATRETRKAPRG